MIGTRGASRQRIRTLATALDDAVRVPGTNFTVGADPILGILPVAGDTVSLLFSLYVIAEAINLGAPPRLVARMLLHVGVDYVGGSVPVLGTVFDAFFKANKRNLALLEEHFEDFDLEDDESVLPSANAW